MAAGADLMSGGTWISSSLTEAKKPQIARALDQILHGTPEARGQFLDRALREIDLYNEVVAPERADSKKRPERLAALAKAGHAFGAAVAALTEGDRDLLEQAQGFVLHKHEEQGFSLTAEAGEWARVSANAADWILREEMRSHAKGGRPRVSSEFLISQLGRAYSLCFGEQPSAATNGIFRQALGVFKHAFALGLPNEPDLRAILRNIPHMAPPPRRGRKPRPK